MTDAGELRFEDLDNSEAQFLSNWQENAQTLAVEHVGGDTAMLYPPLPTAEEGRSAWQIGKAVVKDVVGGVATEGAGAVIKGASAAVKEYLKSLEDINKWKEEHGPKLPPMVEKSTAGMKEALPAAVRGMENLPELSQRETYTGQAIQAISQFLTGLGISNLMTPGAGAVGKGVQTARQLAAGAMSDAFAFDPKGQNLSNLIQSIPALENPVTEFLATDPNDSDAVNRFKRSVEGVVSSVALTGLVAGLRAYRARNAAKSAFTTEEKAALAADEAATEAKQVAKVQGDLSVLGDASPDAPLVRTVEQPRPATVIRQALKDGEHAAAQGEPRVQADILSSDVTPRLPAEDAARLAKNAGNAAPISREDVLFHGKSAGGQGFEKPKGYFTNDLEYARGMTSESHIADKPGTESKIYIVRKSDVTGNNRGLPYSDTEITPIAVVNRDATDAEINAAISNANSVQATGGPIKGLEINFARINSPDDIKAAMQYLVNADPVLREEASKVVTHAEVVARGRGVDPWEVLMRRRAENGASIPLPEEQWALRTLWSNSTQTLADVAEKAAVEPTVGNMFAFRKMMATHTLIQREAMGVRTATARALNQWAIESGGFSSKQMQRMADLLDEVGGQEFNAELAARVAAVAKVAPEKLDELVKKSWQAKTMDSLREIWTNSILSGPQTHIVNTMSNTVTAAQALAERYTAGLYSQALGSGEVNPAEALYAAFGQVEGFKCALGIAKDVEQMGLLRRAWRGDPVALGPSKIEAYKGAISAESYGLKEGSAAARIANGMGAVVGSPGKALEIEDVLFKGIGYWQEMYALAARQASQEVTSGALKPEGMKARIAELVSKPSAELESAAAKAAEYQTFTGKPGPIAGAILQAKQQVPALHFVVPFVRTPSNIFNYALERTPLAPVTQRFRAEYAAGGARRDMAMTKLALGSAMLSLAIDLANQGLITGRGPTNPDERENFLRTAKPYAFKIGDRWYQFSRMDPIANTFMLGADIAQALRDGDFSDKEGDAEKIMAAAVFGLAGNMLNKTYMSGVSDVLQALQDPQRYGENWIQRLAGSVVPSGVAWAARQNDPVMRASADVVDAILKRTPGVSESLPARRDLWGRQMSYESGLGRVYDALVPIASKPDAPEVIDVELKKIGHFPSMPAKTQQFPASDGKQVSIPMANRPDLYYRFVELAGNDAKDPETGLGAMEYLNALVTGMLPESKRYAALDDEGKADAITRVMTGFRKLARRQLLAENGELREMVEKARADDLLEHLPQ